MTKWYGPVIGVNQIDLVLPPGITGLDAFTVATPAWGHVTGHFDDPAAATCRQIAPPGEVAVVGTQKSVRNAPWGELLSTASMARRAAGCVTDGLVRDVRQIREMGFPVFHGGIGPLDTKARARMVDRDVRVECGGVSIESGDLVFGDVDGVVVIPRAHEHAVLGKALDKVTGENHTRDALRTGEPLASVFRRFGIL